MKKVLTPALILASLSIALAALPEGGITVTLPDQPPGQLDQLWDTMTGGNGWVAAMTAWMGSSRVVFKVFGERVKTQLESLLSAAFASKDDEIIARVEGVLRSRTYRFMAFIIDWVTTIKLPALLPPSK